MKAEKLQGTKYIFKNLEHFYRLTVNYQKEKLRKQSRLKLCQKEFKNLGINFIKKNKDLDTKRYDIDERN